jgi:hypothetical protein
VTLLSLGVLIGFKVVTATNWRAATRSSVRQCVQQQSPTATWNKASIVEDLADCLARRQPARHDPIELLTVAALVALAAAEIGYLITHRPPVHPERPSQTPDR